MSEIDLPRLKDKLWHTMRSDLSALVPWFSDQDVLLCPICCRPLGFEEFFVEHIIPKQALAVDPGPIRSSIPHNERSKLTFLCRKPLIIKNKRIPGHGCNSWKGKFYDPFLRDLLSADFRTARVNSRHQLALCAVGYLGLFRRFGFQIALLPSGLLMRRQFFHPNSFLRDVPMSSQMIFTGESWSKLDDLTEDHWKNPISISVEGSSGFVILRNMIFQLPLSRDPTIPIARSLPYAPSKYKFRPDLRTVFD